jgi:hypothetical protein
MLFRSVADQIRVAKEGPRSHTCRWSSDKQLRCDGVLSPLAVNHSIKAPDRTTAEVFPQYIGGQIVSGSATLKWSGLFARRYQFAVW